MRSRQSVLRSSAIASAKEGISLEGYGHRGRKDDPLYRARKLLIRGDERLDERGREKLMEALRRGDPFDEVLGAWLAKEACRSICMEDDADAAAVILDDTIAACAVHRCRDPHLRSHALALARGDLEPPPDRQRVERSDGRPDPGAADHFIAPH